MSTWFSRISRAGSMIRGVQISPDVRNGRRAGAMPTIVYDCPFSTIGEPGTEH